MKKKLLALLGRASDGRASTHEGVTYYGILKKNGTNLPGQLRYEGYFPEFIKTGNTAVASWFYTDFYEEIFTVNAFNPAYQ